MSEFGQACGLIDGCARNFTPASFDDYVRAWHTTCVQPEIVAGGLMKGHFFILTTILAHQNEKTIPTLYRKWHATSGSHGLPTLALLALCSGMLLCSLLNRSAT